MKKKKTNECGLWYRTRACWEVVLSLRFSALPSCVILSSVDVYWATLVLRGVSSLKLCIAMSFCIISPSICLVEEACVRNYGTARCWFLCWERDACTKILLDDLKSLQRHMNALASLWTKFQQEQETVGIWEREISLKLSEITNDTLFSSIPPWELDEKPCKHISFYYYLFFLKKKLENSINLLIGPIEGLNVFRSLGLFEMKWKWCNLLFQVDAVNKPPCKTDYHHSSESSRPVM